MHNAENFTYTKTNAGDLLIGSGSRQQQTPNTSIKTTVLISKMYKVGQI